MKTINGDDVVYLTNIQKFVDGHGRSYISGTVIDPDLSDFQDNFQGDFSAALIFSYVSFSFINFSPFFCKNKNGHKKKQIQNIC